MSTLQRFAMLFPNVHRCLQTAFFQSAGGRGVVFCLLALIAGYGVFNIYISNRSGCVNLREGYYRQAYERSYRAALAGDKSAQNVVGNLLFLGLGVPQDRSAAARWYLKSALSGYVPAQTNLGQMYINGLGVPRRITTAVGWFHLADRAGSRRANEHIKYIGGTNSILPLMFDDAFLKFDSLDNVKRRLKKMGEAAFLFE